MSFSTSRSSANVWMTLLNVCVASWMWSSWISGLHSGSSADRTPRTISTTGNW